MNTRQNRRITAIYFLFLFLFLIISAKIIYLQVFRRIFFQQLAQNQYYRVIPIEGGRGDIFDRRGRLLATGMNCYSIFADPSLVENKNKAVYALNESLGLPKQLLASRLYRDKRFVWIKRKVSWEEKEKVKALGLRGIGFLREEKRLYPQENLAASVLGVVGIDNKGLEGIERSFDDYLRGKDGLARILHDSRSQEVMLSAHIIEPQKGADLVLTIDAQIQYWVECYLAETIDEFNASSGSVIVMDADQGEILALANYPGFNPNKLGNGDISSMRNGAIADMFEPGSVFKLIALVAAISEKAFSDNDSIFCENGNFKIPGSTLHDWRSYGRLSFKEVFMKSSNIGVVKIVESMGAPVFARYLALFEFGRPTGIDLPAESPGNSKPLTVWSKTSPYMIPIGQEIAVNLVQLARAFGSIANNGYLVRPYLVERVCSRDFCKYTSPVKKQILSDSVTKHVKDILVSVVHDGTGKQADIPDMVIGGKTGTAQKFDRQLGHYSPNRYRATFVGFSPETLPPLVIAVSIDEPKRSHFGGVVAAPLFKKIAEKVIPYISSDSTFAKR